MNDFQTSTKDSSTKLKELIIPIYYEDTDFTGFVYHANYLKFFERAREEGLGRVFLKKLYENKKHFVVRNINIKYIQPTKHGQELIIQSSCFLKSTFIIKFEQQAIDSLNKKISTQAQLDLVLINERGWPLRIPSNFLQQESYSDAKNIDFNSENKNV